MFCVASAASSIRAAACCYCVIPLRLRASAVITESAGLHIRGLDYNLLLIPNI